LTPFEPLEDEEKETEEEVTTMEEPLSSRQSSNFKTILRVKDTNAND